METKFAPAARLPKYKIINHYKELSRNTIFIETLNILNSIVALLNSNRQVVFANDAWLAMLGNLEINKLLGKRPGEIFNCIHAYREKGGCGTAEECSVCGAVLTVLESIKTNTKISNEARITVCNEGKEQCFDLFVTAMPFQLNGSGFTLVILNDISSSKRKAAIENIFFHDIMNSLGNLMGIIELLNLIDNPDKKEQLSKRLMKIGHYLIEEVSAQKDLINAENGSLNLSLSTFTTNNFIEEIISKVMYHRVAKNRQVIIEPDSCDMIIHSDSRLLSRVLTNMLKNALEAEDEGSTIRILARELDSQMEISVKNESYIPKEVQMQIFQRSFSTKDECRGLGTYSMKLITDQYLKGEISFNSSERDGTEFKVNIPVIYPE